MFVRSRRSILSSLALALFLLPSAHLAQADESSDIDPKKVFARNCSWCHGDYGRTAGKAKQLKGTKMTEKQVFDRIADGLSGKMPSYKKSLSKEEIQALAVFIKNLENE